MVFIFSKGKVLAEDDAYHFPGLAPGRLVFTSDYSELFVSIDLGVMMLNPDTMEPIETYPITGHIYDIAVSEVGNYVYCSHNPDISNQGKLSRINTETSEVQTIDLSPANVYCSTFDDAGEFLYVAGGTWPAFHEPYSPWDYPNHYGSGRIFEIRLSDFTLTRTADLAVGLESGLSYQGGKLVVMSPEVRERPLIGSDSNTLGATCHIISVCDLTIEYSLGVQYGNESTSLSLPGDTDVMLGFSSDSEDGVGFGLLNTTTGEIEEWIVTDPNPYPPDWTPEGGGFMMTVDTANNLLYSTMNVTRPLNQPSFRLGIVDLNTNVYYNHFIVPFRVYRDIVFDPVRDKLYLSSPLDDAIVVLDPPEYVHTHVPPVACFTYNPASGPSPLMVTIDNCSYDEDGEIVRIDCDWDADGEIDEVMEGNPDVLVHTFIEPGTTDFILTVVDDDELMATWEGSVDVG